MATKRGNYENINEFGNEGTYQQLSIFDSFFMGDDTVTTDRVVENVESADVRSVNEEQDIVKRNKELNIGIGTSSNREEERIGTNDSGLPNGQLESFEPKSIGEAITIESTNDDLANESTDHEGLDFELSVLDDSTLSAKVKLENNIKAIETLKKLMSENRIALTNEEKKILQGYTGWGGLPQIFNEGNQETLESRNLLKNMLTVDEYQDAKASTLSSFYTPLEIVRFMYQAIVNQGFQGGYVLEPACGTGNMFGMMPSEMRKHSALYGVELDAISGNIAKYIYDKANIEIKGFEESNTPKNTFDLVIGNVPFGNYQIADKDFNKYRFMVHDYFIAKSLDKLRDHGISVLITSHTTLDNPRKDIISYLDDHTAILGAVRLPSDIFKSNGANTATATDIIFLQKDEEKTLDSSLYKNEEFKSFAKFGHININNYFVKHPEMVIGIMGETKAQFDSYDLTVSGVKKEQLSQKLNNTLTYLPINNFEEVEPETIKNENILNYGEIKNANKLKENSYFLHDGVPYIFHDGRGEKVVGTPTVVSRIASLIEIKELVLENIAIQNTIPFKENDYLESRKNLNEKYDQFVKKHNFINSRNIAKLLSDDPDLYIVLNVEKKNFTTGYYEKADIFNERTIVPLNEIKSTDNLKDAVYLSINKYGVIDLDYIESIYNKQKDVLLEEINQSKFIFLDPKSNEYVINSEYLSGNIREKINFIENLPNKGEYQKNLIALQGVVPTTIDISDVKVQFGSSYIPPEIVSQFASDSLQTNDLNIDFNKSLGTWSIRDNDWHWHDSNEAKYTWGVPMVDTKKLPVVKNSSGEIVDPDYISQPEYRASNLFEDVLNNKIPTIYDYWDEEYIDNTGKWNQRRKSRVNASRTASARDLAISLETAWEDWLYNHSEHAKRLQVIYNDLFNSVVNRTYDGSYLSFNGLNASIQLEEYQKNAVSRIISGNNTLLSQHVGAGKTFEMIVAGMKMKQMGLKKKILYVVPNSLVNQWKNDFMTLYPNANILATTPVDFSKKNRNNLIHKIALNNYDAIIVSHSSFKMIPMDREIEIQYNQQEIAELETALSEEGSKNRSEQNNSIVKQLQRSKKSIENNVKRLRDIQKDNGITFDQLGIDFMFVDEAHAFKNLYTWTVMRNIAGVPQSNSQKASDMLLKCRYIQEHNGQVCFATGTPITNTMAELYTMQKYLQPQELERLGIRNFDSWAKQFGQVISSLECTVDGSSYHSKLRFNKFFNIQELMTSFREVAEIQTESMLKKDLNDSKYHRQNAKAPEHITGKPIVVVQEPSQELEDYISNVVERIEAIHNGSVNPSIDNMLKVTMDSKKASIDLRLVDEAYGKIPGSKLSAVAEKVAEIYHKYDADKATQLIFCDSSKPKKKFNVYDEIKNDLVVNKGINPEEIAFIHDYETDSEKRKLFSAVNAGRIRILLGSTEKLGTGTNVQKRLIAVHHVDVPWRASDIEQRNGRAFRQGNMYDQIYEFRYATKKSFDSYSWQIIENKSTYMNQLLSGNSGVREMKEDSQATFSYAEIKAIASGDPLIKEKIDLENRIQELEFLQARYRKNRLNAIDQKAKLPLDLEKYKNIESVLHNDVEIMKKIPRSESTNAEFIDKIFEVKTKNKTYYSVKEYGEYLNDLGYKMYKHDDISQLDAGSWFGFEFALVNKHDGNGIRLVAFGEKGNIYDVNDLNQVGRVNVNRMYEALTVKVPLQYASAVDGIKKCTESLSNIDGIINGKFKEGNELEKKQHRLNEINTILTKDDKNVVLDDELSEEDAKKAIKEAMKATDDDEAMISPDMEDIVALEETPVEEQSGGLYGFGVNNMKKRQNNDCHNDSENDENIKCFGEDSHDHS